MWTVALSVALATSPLAVTAPTALPPAGATTALAPAAKATTAMRLARSASDPTATMVGCAATIISYDSSGKQLARLVAPTDKKAAGGNALPIDARGRLVYQGSLDNLTTDLSWVATVDGITVRRGSGPNAELALGAVGEVALAEVFPVKVTGRYHVRFTLTGTGGACQAEMWVRLIGNPLTTVPFWAGVLLTVLGAVALRRVTGHVLRGVLGGFAIGLGVVLLVVTTGVGGFTAWWPMVVILVVAGAVGAVIAWVAKPTSTEVGS